MEIKARELEGRSLIAFEAASRGFTTIIGNKIHIKKMLRDSRFPPGIYFEKSLTRGKDEQIREMANKGCCIVSQDEESGILKLSYDKFLSIRSTSDTVNSASAIFCWGDNDYNAWKNYYSNCKEKFYLTGSPRIDFWRPEFHSYYQQDVDLILKKYKKFVLISSNFSQANSYMTENERIERAKRVGVIKSKQDEDEIDKIRNRVDLFNCFGNLVNHLSSKYRNVNFIVRPHPSENMAGWKKALKNRNNIHIVFEGSISPWVRASKLVLHNACTTGIEAYVSGIPAVAYLPIKSDRNEKLSNQISIACSTENEVINCIDNVIEKKNFCSHFNTVNDNLIGSKLINIKGDIAAKKIVDVLEKLNVDEYSTIRTGYSEWISDKRLSARRIFDKFRRFENKSIRKFPNLKLSELKKIQKNLTKVKNNYGQCEIKHLFGDVFLIETK
jgi:surface carbohydrate biosynthesis protein